MHRQIICKKSVKNSYSKLFLIATTHDLHACTQVHHTSVQRKQEYKKTYKYLSSELFLSCCCTCSHERMTTDTGFNELLLLLAKLSPCLRMRKLSCFPRCHSYSHYFSYCCCSHSCFCVVAASLLTDGIPIGGIITVIAIVRVAAAAAAVAILHAVLWFRAAMNATITLARTIIFTVDVGSTISDIRES